jgi:hypothetical protein
MPLSADRLRRLRLASQRLSPDTAAADAREAAASVCGVQAQDLRAAALALRARVPGLERSAIADAGLIRVWTVRGTIHMLPAEDWQWMHAALGERFLARMEQILEKRGALDLARSVLGDLVELISEQPLTRAQILERLAAKGHPEFEAGPMNVVMPWVVYQGLAVGDSEGRWMASDPPPGMDADEALATLAERYLQGYGPATAGDLARWSGLALGTARRALDAAGPPEAPEDPPDPAPAKLLGGFDTIMLGHESREPVLAAEHDRRILPGGGILKATVLSRGRAVGTWRLVGGGARRRLELDLFGRPPRRAALAAEAEDVGRFLGVAVDA